MNRYIPLIVLLLLVNAGIRAQAPAPGAPQQKPIILSGGTIHVGNGQVLENNATGTTYLRFEEGVITEVGMVDRFDDAGAEVIDVTGKHIYPGLIAPDTYLGLNEIDAVRPTRDYDETGQVNPNVRSIIAYNTDSRITPTIRSNGILLAETAPVGGLISGTSTVVQLDAWNWEDAAYNLDHALYLNWPSIQRRTGWWANPGPVKDNEQYEQTVQQIYDLLDDAKAYYEGERDTENQKLEAMGGLFSGDKKLFIRVDGAREIMAALDLKTTYGIKLVVVGARDAWMVTDALKEAAVPVIYRQTHGLPHRPEDDIDMTYKTPSLLQQAGITYCLGIWGSWEQRNLPFHAGTAAAYGLTKEEALAAVTLNTAKILGVDDKTGSLQKGKDANIVISEGDILDMRTSKITGAFIQGRKVNLDNHQKELSDKFRAKYKQEAP